MYQLHFLRRAARSTDVSNRCERVSATCIVTVRADTLKYRFLNNLYHVCVLMLQSVSVIWRDVASFGISSDRFACLQRSRAFVSAVLLFSACLNVLGKLSVLRTLHPAAETAVGRGVWLTNNLFCPQQFFRLIGH